MNYNLKEVFLLKDVVVTYIKKPYNLEINPGEKVLIIGENGSGKTTLIYLLIGFIKPKSGIFKKTNKLISYLAEKADLPRNLKAGEYLEIIAKTKKGYVNKKYIDFLELPLDTEIKNLSKGNKQKLAFLAALIGDSEVLILDEPLSGFDPEKKKKIVEILKQETKDKTVLIISHSPEVFSSFVTRKITLCWTIFLKLILTEKQRR